MSTDFSKALNAYQTTSDKNMSGMEICAKLYQGILKNLKEAKQAFVDGELERMVELNGKTNKILIALQSHLNKNDSDPEIKRTSEWLNNFYNTIFMDLGAVLRKDDTAAEYDRIIEYFTPVYERWSEFAQETAVK